MGVCVSFDQAVELSAGIVGAGPGCGAEDDAIGVDDLNGGGRDRPLRTSGSMKQVSGGRCASEAVSVWWALEEFVFLLRGHQCYGVDA